MKKRNIFLIITISITAIALGTVLLLFVTNNNAADTNTSVVDNIPYDAPAFEEDEALDENMNFVNANKNKSGGTIGIIPAYKTYSSAEVESNGTAEEPTAPSESVKLGDANLDGDINILDATHIQKMIVGLIEATEGSNAAADVNGDNSVNIADATLIQKYCVGLISSFVGSESTTEPSKSVEDTNSGTGPSTSNLPPKAPNQNGEWGALIKN